MKKTGVPYKASVKYPGKKTISLSEETNEKWELLSEKYKVAVTEAVRPFIDEEIRRLYNKVVEAS